MTTVLPDHPRPADPWRLYHDLLADIPDGITVTDCTVSHWTYVSTDAGSTGLAMTTEGGPRLTDLRDAVIGTDLRTVAGYVTSWDLTLASIGAAALNSWHNTLDRVMAYDPDVLDRGTSTFDEHLPYVHGRRVATVGHFRIVERLAEECELTVLERRPSGDDLPDSACEYLLADAEVVFITGSTIVNKTLPRLLELSRHANVVLVGPSTPIVPHAFARTVDEIAGAVVVDEEWCRRAVRIHAGTKGLRPALQYVRLPLSRTGEPDGVDRHRPVPA